MVGLFRVQKPTATSVEWRRFIDVVSSFIIEIMERRLIQLPPEIWLEILYKLEPEELLRVSTCCKLWQYATKSEVYWKKFFFKRTGLDECFEKTWKETYFKFSRIWRKLDGEWNVHCSAVLFGGNIRFISLLAV